MSSHMSWHRKNLNEICDFISINHVTSVLLLSGDLSQPVMVGEVRQRAAFFFLFFFLDV